MSVTLRKRKNADGTTSLRMDICHDRKHTILTLKDLQLSAGTGLVDRAENKKLLETAEAICLAKRVELESNNYDITSDAGKNTIVAVWMQSYIDKYTKKDKRNMQGARNRFAAFLLEIGRPGVTFGKLTPLLIEDFIDYLQSNSRGEGALSYYNRFKKMIKQAYRQQVIKVNVLDLVERKVKGKAKKKDTLTIDEIRTLGATPIENATIRRAALFSTVTGLAFCDVKTLQWKNIKLQTKKLEIVREKGKDDNNTVSIPLNATAIKLLGDAGKPGVNVFELPTANGCNKTLKAWVRRAGIDKKITWHNLRHSYGTNLIFNDVDLLTASKLLGHTSTKHTGRYVKASEEMKQTATDKLNFDL